MTAPKMVTDFATAYWEQREAKSGVFGRWGQSHFEGIKLDAQSSTPEELDAWLNGLAYKVGVARDWRTGGRKSNTD